MHTMQSRSVFTVGVFGMRGLWPLWAVLGDGRGHSCAPPPKHALRSPGSGMPAPHFAKLTPDKWLHGGCYGGASTGKVSR